MSSKGLLHHLEGDTFFFSCHKGTKCFTRCCAALQLVLTPYDILRIKNRLGISSGLFLEAYTNTRFDRHPRFPMVLLKMNQDDSMTCPFLIPEGCTLYNDRPGACRLYPMARAARKGESDEGAKEKFFLVAEEHCLGFEEKTPWTVKSWMSDQGLDEYIQMNDRWLEITGSPRSLGPKEDIPRKLQMFYMVSYNLDKFRLFLFRSNFFHRFRVPEELQARLEKDDVDLMLFGFEWLKFSLFGLPTMEMK
jgi:Fe-S-cluster containining protein